MVDSKIVHRFSVHGFQMIQPDLGEALPRHTAGDVGLTWTAAAGGASGDFSYVSEPVTWPIAPAHVELAGGLFVATGTFCYSAFPSPLFSYDVSAP